MAHRSRPVTKRPRPTREEMLAAAGRTISDVIAPGLDVLFCGINPGLYSGAVGHHFARPGNRFWPALHLSGFTDRQLSPFDADDLLDHGLGVTNIVARTTRAASDLSADELRAGAAELEIKVRRLRPEWLAVVGLGAYRHGFGRPHADVGPQPERIGTTRVWLLPNTSGLNAHWQLPELVEAFTDLRRATERP